MYAANIDCLSLAANPASEAHLFSSTLLDAGISWQAWTVPVGKICVDTTQFDAFHGAAGTLEFASPPYSSPQRAEWIEEDNYVLAGNVGTFFGTHDQHLDGVGSLIEHLPDELLRHIFHFLPAAHDRSACASVSKRWLLVQSHMCPDEFEYSVGGAGVYEEDDEVQSRDATSYSKLVQFGTEKRAIRQSQWALGDLSRTLEGGKASDVRLCAVAVGTGARGGLGKLSLHQSIGTDVGLSAIGYCCSALRTLSLWDCPYIGDDGLSLIGKGCGLLEKVDLFKCPLLGDLGLQSIAKNCPLLSFLSLNECALLTDRSLTAIGEGCSNLLSLSLRGCPSIKDDGLASLICNAKRLRRLKLDGLKIGNKTLACIGLHAKAMVRLTLANLDLVTEKGFLQLALEQNMPSLGRFSVINCKSFGDTVCANMSKMGQCLKHVSFVRCSEVSDTGLALFMQNAASLEVLQLEMCNAITVKGLINVFSNAHGKLKVVSFKSCGGLGEVGALSAPFQSQASSVKSVSITDSSKVTDVLLALVGCHCPNATSIDFSGLTAISDEGILAFLYSGRRQLAKVNLSGCKGITDRAVLAIAEQSGAFMTSLYLNGCRSITDKSLQSVAKHCIVLEELEVSQCKVTNCGVREVLLEAGPMLYSLNLSRCRGITDRLLPLILEYCCCLSELNLMHCQGLSQKYISLLESRLWNCNILSA